MAINLIGFLSAIDRLGNRIPLRLQKELVEYIEEFRYAIENNDLELYQRNLSQDIILSTDWCSVALILFLQYVARGKLSEAANLFALLSMEDVNTDFDTFDCVKNQLAVFV